MKNKLRKLVLILLVCGMISCAAKPPAVVNEECFKKIRAMALDGSRYMRKNSFQESVNLFNEALGLCKKCYPLESIPGEGKKNIIGLYLGAYSALCSDYLLLGDYPKAIDLAGEAALKLPEFAAMFNDLAASGYAMQGEFNKAVDICENTLRLFPDNRDTYFILGKINFSQKDYVKARVNFNKCLELAKRNGDKKTVSKAEKMLKVVP